MSCQALLSLEAATLDCSLQLDGCVWPLHPLGSQSASRCVTLRCPPKHGLLPLFHVMQVSANLLKDWSG